MGRRFSRKQLTVWAVAVLVIAAALYLFFPRNVKNLLFTGDPGARVEVVKTAGETEDMQTISLTAQQQKALYELCGGMYARRKLFPKKYVNSHTMSTWLVFVADNQDVIHILSPNLISVGDTQYQLYGQSLTAGLETILESGK